MSAPLRASASAVEACLLVFWLGAALFFAAGVAPAAFAVLPDSGAAGALVGRLLPQLFVGGVVCGAIVAAIEVVAPRRGRLLRGAGVGVMVVACAVAQLVIGARIARLRSEIGRPVAELSAQDARRVAFGRLHGLSVGSLGAAMLAAAAVVASVARRPGAVGHDRGA